MRDWSLRTLGLVGLVSAAGVGGSMAAQGTASPDVLNALLVEVRGLRGAVETMASAGPHIQLALGRLQLQEQRVNNLLRRQTEVRERLAAAERDADMLAREAEGLQQRLSQGDFEEKDRKSVQLQIGDAKERHGRAIADVQRLRVEENDVTQLVTLEQGRWIAINQQLDDLERMLKRN